MPPQWSYWPSTAWNSKTQIYLLQSFPLNSLIVQKALAVLTPSLKARRLGERGRAWHQQLRYTDANHVDVLVMQSGGAMPVGWVL